MATKKTAEERLEELDKRMKQIKAQKQKIINQQNKKERAARTRRLIERGAILEKILKESYPEINFETMENDELLNSYSILISKKEVQF